MLVVDVLEAELDSYNVRHTRSGPINMHILLDVVSVVVVVVAIREKINPTEFTLKGYLLVVVLVVVLLVLVVDALVAELESSFMFVPKYFHTCRSTCRC